MKHDSHQFFTQNRFDRNSSIFIFSCRREIFHRISSSYDLDLNSSKNIQTKPFHAEVFQIQIFNTKSRKLSAHFELWKKFPFQASFNEKLSKRDQIFRFSRFRIKIESQSDLARNHWFKSNLFTFLFSNETARWDSTLNLTEDPPKFSSFFIFTLNDRTNSRSFDETLQVSIEFFNERLLDISRSNWKRSLRKMVIKSVDKKWRSRFQSIYKIQVSCCFLDFFLWLRSIRT